MEEARISRRDEAGVCTLTLDRADKLNVLDLAAFEALDAHVAALEADETVGCVVLRGAGRGFCAGADLNEVAAGGGTERPPRYKPGVIDRLNRLAKPTITAVHGVCYTGGLELALACDFIVADATARFADTHGKWGFVGSWGMSQRLPRRIGLPAAKRMMFTGRVLGAQEAQAIGLVDILAEAGALDDLLAGFTGEICANSWFTNAETKRLLIDTDGMSLAQGLAHEHFRFPGRAPDSAERIARFSKK
jgi:enoyl-CoA hydratase/carnithine racemase